MNHDHYMRRCLELAALGFGAVAPNPMVGSVIVKDDVTLGEGFHHRFGGVHAEIDACDSVVERSLLKGSTLYVNLEPCSHHGKTPPCAEFIKNSGISRVVIGAMDPNPLVAGRGIALLRSHGIEVIVGIMESECRKLNRRFYTFHEKKRPFYILKWAQTSDGFIARKNYSSKWISSEASRELVHKWRSEEMGIMVGTYTAWYDNPKLIAHGYTTHPTRIVLDREQRIPTSFHVFDETTSTILFNDSEDYAYHGAELVKIDFRSDILGQVNAELHKRGIQSVIVEGGATLLQSFIDAKLWDEARVFSALKTFGEGIKAPEFQILEGEPVMNGQGDTLHTSIRS